MVNLRCESSTTSMLLPYLSEIKLFSHKVGFQFYPYLQQGQRINVFSSESTFRVICLETVSYDHHIWR